MEDKVTKMDFTGEDVFVGIDVHAQSWKVTTMTRNLVHKTFSMEPNVKRLYSHLTNHFPGATYFSAYEAGFSGFWLHRELSALGVHSRVVNAADVPTTDKERTQKEDKRDSRKIAQGLRSAELRSIYTPTEKEENDRCLIRKRGTIVKDITRTKNRIKALLYFNGKNREISAKNYWSKRIILLLEQMEFDHPSGKLNLKILLDELEMQRMFLLRINRQIKELSRTDDYRENVELLLTIPGIGLTSAMVILTELCTLTRFKNFAHLSSYLGLVPSTHSSGSKTIVNGITHRTNSRLRGVLIESSWVAIRNDPAMGMAYEKLTKRMHGNRAIIRIAKKLLSRMVHILNKKEPYRKSMG